MKKIVTLKNLLFILALQIMSGSWVKAVIKTDDMDAQAKALGDASGLSVDSDLSVILAVSIQVVLGFLGIIFLFLTLQAGFKWMTSQGNEKDIEEAKASLKNAVIGLVVVICAYAITRAVFIYLPFATGGPGVQGSGTLAK